MAVNARFQADFSSFIQAIDKAELALVDMSKGANKVESSLNRMVDNFSGRKMIQEASLMTIAIEKAGGVSALTAKELEQAGNKAAEAADKLRRLGYEVPAGLQNIANQAKTTTSTFDDMRSMVTNLAGAFGVVFSVQAVIGFGRELLAAADSLVKLHDKTGISVEGLQRFQVAGDDAGNTLDEITNAIVKMEDKLVSGDKSAIGALQTLGLSLDDLRRMTPEQQFIAISDALRQIDDPAKQVNVAIDLFGKQGANVLPTLKRGFDDLKDSVVGMSRDTVRTLDDVGDALGRLFRSAKGLGGTGFAAAINAFLDPGGIHAWAVSVEEATKKATLAAPAFKAMAPPGLPEDLDAIEKALTKSATATKKVAEETVKLTPLLIGSALGFKRYQEAMIGTVGLMPELTGMSAAMRATFDEALASINDLTLSTIVLTRVETETGAVIGGTVIPVFSKLPNVVAQSTDELNKAAEAAVTFADSLKNTVGSALSGLNNIFQSAFEGGGGVLGAVKSFATRMTSGLLDLIPVVGGFLSQFAGAFVAGISKLFGGVSAAEKQARADIQAFEKELASSLTATQKAEAGNKSWALTTIAVRDAYLATGRSAAEAEAAVQLLWASSKQGADAAKAAMDAINAVLDEQKQDAADLDAAVQRYGFTIEELGPAMQRQKLDEQAQQLLNDWRLLVGSGIDLTTVNERMASSVQDYLAMALKTGMEVPAAMKPILQSMIDQGQLVDENGNLITDLGQIGVTFSETMTQGFDKIVKKLQELLDKIGMVPGALANIPQPNPIHIPIVYDDPGFRREENFAAQGGLVTSNGISPQYFGSGGNVLAFRPRGTDTVPAMLTPGERVLTVRENKAFEAGAGVSELHKEIRQLRQQLADSDRNLPKRIRDAILLAG